MLRLMEKLTILGCKKETVPYTAEILTASNYNQRIYDIKCTKDIESYARKLARGDYSRDVSIAGKRKVTITCSVDIYPGATVATAPAYFDMLEGCGYKKTAYTTTGIGITPHANYNRVPLTFEVAYNEEGSTPRQSVVKVKGAMGKIKLEATQIGQPMKVTFEFTGSLVSITTRAYASAIVPTAFDTSLPPAVLAATFSLFGTWQFPNKFSIDGGEVVDIFSDISTVSGYEGSRITDRNVTGECDPDMIVTDDFDYHTKQINNTTGALSVTIGGSVPMYITAPAVQIVSADTPDVREGHLTNSLKLEFKRGTTGNDEFELLQGAKS